MWHDEASWHGGHGNSVKGWAGPDIYRGQRLQAESESESALSALFGANVEDMSSSFKEQSRRCESWGEG